MLERPDPPDELIMAFLRGEYGLSSKDIAFLPLGADVNAAAYRVDAAGGQAYFLKLRRGAFDAISVALPKFLNDEGVRQVVGPIVTNGGQLWAILDDCHVILYPFVEGRNGHDAALSEKQWYEFGSALQKIHAVRLPDSLAESIPVEAFGSEHRDAVRHYLGSVETDRFDDPVAVRVAAFLKDRRDQISDLVSRSERLARRLADRSLELVLCHTDLHAANTLMDAGGALHIVDWDSPLWAPKERDLMFIGGAQGFLGYTPEEEEALFYRGYGECEVDPLTLAYYRYERVIVDIDEFCEQLLLSSEGGEDREQSLGYLMSSFRPGGPLEAAHRSDPDHGG